MAGRGKEKQTRHGADDQVTGRSQGKEAREESATNYGGSIHSIILCLCDRHLSQQGCRQPSLELFPPANITLSNLTRAAFPSTFPLCQKHPFRKLLTAWTLCLVELRACCGPEPTFCEASHLSGHCAARCCLKATEPRQIHTCSSLLDISCAGPAEQRPKGSAVAAPRGACSRAGSHEHSCCSWSCHWQTGPTDKEIAHIFGKLGPNLKKMLFLGI